MSAVWKQSSMCCLDMCCWRQRSAEMRFLVDAIWCLCFKNKEVCVAGSSTKLLCTTFPRRLSDIYTLKMKECVLLEAELSWDTFLKEKLISVLQKQRSICCWRQSFLVSIPRLKSQGSPSVDDKVVHAAFPHSWTYCHNIQVQCYPTYIWQWHSDFRYFSDGVCHVMKNTIPENNLDKGP